MDQRLIILAIENVVKKTPEKSEWICISSSPYTFLRAQRQLSLYTLHYTTRPATTSQAYSVKHIPRTYRMHRPVASGSCIHTALL